MASLATHPVQVLREHGTALEAALSVCLVDPGHRPVHRLRTETRRVEAQLLLLAQLPEMPDHHRQAERLQKSLKRLRRAAGKIRDLDVQRKHLETLGNAGEAPSDGASLPPDQEILQKAAAQLSAHLQDRREKAVHKLQALLAKRQGKAAQAVEALVEVLAPVTEFALPTEVLLSQAQAVFTRSGLLDDGSDAIDKLDETELHDLRKASKAARYLAENLPEDASAVQRARHYEALQQAGGEWHDGLDLARAAGRFLGKKHALTAKVVAQRETALALYRELLRAEARPSSESKRSAKQQGAKPRRKPPTPATSSKVPSVTPQSRKASTKGSSTREQARRSQTKRRTSAAA